MADMNAKETKAAATTRAANEIIDAETDARDAKTARLKAARERARVQEIARHRAEINSRDRSE